MPKTTTVCLLASVLFGRASIAADRDIDFTRDVAPIFEKHCLLCHKAGHAEGDLSLATGDGLREAGYVVPGDPEGSHLIALVTPSDGQRPEMPKTGTPLTDAQVEVLRRWIQDGAEWPDDALLPALWSLAPITPIDLNRPEDVEEPSHWSRQPIDRFVLKRLRDQGLKPAPTALRRELIRRLKYDLLGLPPTPEEIAAFVNDRRDDAWERLVDRFLASPHLGERWAQHWLDVVRFSESNGFEDDAPRPHAWPYRDYVIRSFNEDKPYDQFVREQIAGDVLAPITHDSMIATSMLVNGPFDHAAAVSASKTEQLRAREVMLEELLTTIGQSILGLTVNCARCHDHKFDPIPQEDYYRIKAVFEGVLQADSSAFRAQPVLTPDEATQWNRDQEALKAAEAVLAKLREQRAALDDTGTPPPSDTPLPSGKETTPRQQEGTGTDAVAIQQLDGRIADAEQQVAVVRQRLDSFPKALIGIRKQPAPTVLFERGDIRAPGQPVSAAGLSAVKQLPSQLGIDQHAEEAERRRRFAHWVTEPRNPLTARVIVNRVWHHHFGVGIVETPSDFGANGGRPSHPELLDWLAARFIADGWSLKELHRRILTSATWRQSSQFNARAASVDADNRLLWRFTPRRLDAETVRDAMLFASGELSPQLGGSSFQPFTTTTFNTTFYHLFDKGDSEFNRRTIYRMHLNTGRDPLLDALDCPAPSVLTPHRRQTITPLQALGLMNDTFVLRQAEKLATRLEQNKSDPNQQIGELWQRTLGHEPDPDDLARAADVICHADLQTLCWVLFNSSEFLQIR